MLDQITLAGYLFCLLEIRNSTDNSQQTWTYSVTKIKDEALELKYWSLELCQNPFHRVICTTSPSAPSEIYNSTSIPGVYNSIKWSYLNNQNVNGLYTITLKGCFSKEKIKIAVGLPCNCVIGKIIGPGCKHMNLP